MMIGTAVVDAKAMRDPFDWMVWLTNGGIRRCGLAARGLWVDLLAFMHTDDEFGCLTNNGQPLTNDEAAKMVGIPPRRFTKLMADLEGNGVCRRDARGAISSPGMRQSRQKIEQARVNGARGGNPLLVKNRIPVNPTATPAVITAVHESDPVPRELQVNHPVNPSVNPRGAILTPPTEASSSERVFSRPDRRQIDGIPVPEISQVVSEINVLGESPVNLTVGQDEACDRQNAPPRPHAYARADKDSYLDDRKERKEELPLKEDRDSRSGSGDEFFQSIPAWVSEAFDQGLTDEKTESSQSSTSDSVPRASERMDAGGRAGTGARDGGDAPPPAHTNTADGGVRRLTKEELSKMPRANDPPHRWIGAALTTDDAGNALWERDNNGVPRPVAGNYTHMNQVALDLACQKIAEKALFHPQARQEWTVVVGWLNEGFDVLKDVIPAIEHVRRVKSDYTPPQTIFYFDKEVRNHYMARMAHEKGTAAL